MRVGCLPLSLPSGTPEGVVGLILNVPEMYEYVSYVMISTFTQ